jgi:hypothetical protein
VALRAQLEQTPRKEQDMTRNTIALAGLVLALAILSPASALAEAKCPASAPAGADGKCRSVKLSSTGTVRLNTETRDWTADGTAIGTHTGEGPVSFYNGRALVFRFTPPNLVALELEADVTLVAANGDELYGHNTGTTEDFVLGAAHKDEAHITITDGSGRFDGAYGQLDAIIDVGSGTFVPAEDGVIWMLSPYQSTVTGYLIY